MVDKMKLNKIEKGWYQGTINGKKFRATSSYSGKEGLCKTVQSWTLGFENKSIAGLRSKKHAIEVAKRLLQ